jgi:ribosomal-protein-alanine N-acetyltransferase
MTDIRSARPGDLDDIVTLEARTFGEEAWSPRSVESDLEHLGVSRLIDVAIDRGRVVGYVSLMYAGDSGDLLRIAVAVTHRRLGLASRMLTRILDRAREQNLQQVLLEVSADNDAALALYAGHGFAEIDRRSEYYPSGEAAVVMRVLLNTRTRNEGEGANDE